MLFFSIQCVIFSIFIQLNGFMAGKKTATMYAMK